MRHVRAKGPSAEPQPVTLASASADLLASFLGKPKKPRANNPGSRRKQYIEAMEKRVDSQKQAHTDLERDAVWADMTAGQLVALYWVCHHRLYGVVPGEIDTAAGWSRAMKAAGSMVKNQFEGNVQLAVRFMRWCWHREREREEWRRKNKVPGKRIIWQQQFLWPSLVSDWRAEKVRRGA